jgi:hypothetical protein
MDLRFAIGGWNHGVIMEGDGKLYGFDGIYKKIPSPEFYQNGPIDLKRS